MKKLGKLITVPFLTLFGLFAFSGSVFAGPPSFDDWEIIDTIMEFLSTYAFWLGVLIAVIMMIVGGYMWMVAGGDPQKTKTAQGTLTWAIIGVIFLGIFKFIIEILIDFLGVSI